jgi:hypothetical protein
LPDEGARQRLAGASGLSAGNAFGLLEVIGGECAGALSLFPSGLAPEPSGRPQAEILSPERLDEIPSRLRTRPLLGGDEGIRLSLAGQTGGHCRWHFCRIGKRWSTNDPYLEASHPGVGTHGGERVLIMKPLVGLRQLKRRRPVLSQPSARPAPRNAGCNSMITPLMTVEPLQQSSR